MSLKKKKTPHYFHDSFLISKKCLEFLTESQLDIFAAPNDMQARSYQEHSYCMDFENAWPTVAERPSIN